MISEKGEPGDVVAQVGCAKFAEAHSCRTMNDRHALGTRMVKVLF